ncbi:hypothetical protein OG394_06140 [Kribbella sp. NBC_01245]|uniref:hypothetical protein n=1 Tax=Kribbella sp. NBC_01245 TaxID=2903578 RepID=UPI002E2D4B5A|nr:hypothetical protein [Kribbella sp. NBC_01245]
MPVGTTYTMLFYPLVHPPKLTLFEAVLYWDGLTSLVPTNVNYFSAFGNSNELGLLRDEGIYTPTLLDDNLPGYDALVDQLAQISSLFDTYHHPPSEQLNMYTRLWQGKLPLRIEHDLLSSGLIVPDDTQPGAFRGHAGMLSALLSLAASQAATQLQRIPGRSRFIPSTSDEFADRCATDPTAASQVTPSWVLDVSRALPVPPQDTPLERVLDFRAEFEDERRGCVRAVRDLQNDLRECIDDPSELVWETQEKIDAALTELRSGARARFGDIATRSVAVTVAISAPLAAGLHGGPLITAGAVALSGLAINIASRNIRKADDRFSYIYQLEKRFPATAFS